MLDYSIILNRMIDLLGLGFAKDEAKLFVLEYVLAPMIDHLCDIPGQVDERLEKAVADVVTKCAESCVLRKRHSGFVDQIKRRPWTSAIRAKQ